MSETHTPKPMSVRDRLKSKSKKEKSNPKSQDRRLPNAIGKTTGNRAKW